MRFSFYLNPQTPGPDQDGKLIGEILNQIDEAESYGFSDVWLTEHHFTGYNVYSDALTLAAAISQRNPSMHLGFAVSVVPLQHPIRFATQINLLDQLSNGKVIIGIGPGNAPLEFNGFGVDVSERHDIMMEFLDVCHQAWNNPNGGFEYKGKYYNGKVKGRIIPSPVQSPHPPIAFASATPERLEWIGSNGWSLLLGPQQPDFLAARMEHYLKGMEKAQLTDEQRVLAWKNVSVLRQIYVAEEGENWRETLADVMETYVTKSALANSGIDDMPKDDLEERLEKYKNGHWLYGGTPDEVIEQLTPFAEMGISNLMCWMNFGHIDDKLMRASMKRFADKVMPVLRDIKPKDDKINELLKLNPERLRFAKEQEAEKAATAKRFAKS
jgi:alkanesulfonate monooxygenase SsuD/methylene tetrahydromethanopterin reductase-like flavin-dependent oxidoreductase (luciferase family)